MTVARLARCKILPSHLPRMHLPSAHRQMSIAAGLKNSSIFRSQGLIGGKWIGAHDGKTIQVNNPATGEIIADVPFMGRRETNDAISSAYNAFNSWSKQTAAERSKCLRKWYDLIMSHKEELGQLITLEQGKPLKEALGEVSYGASFIEFFAEEAKRVYGDIIPATLADRRLFVLKQPVGVVGAITPWNFPLAMITRKVGPALACGCTVVVKPSELTPLTALAAAELALQAGIPPGVLNVVMGNAPDIGDALLASPQVRKITFTGSTAVGKKLMAGAAGTVKRISLELGGNAPCIVFDDADLDDERKPDDIQHWNSVHNRQSGFAMGHELKSLFQLDTRKLIWLIGMTFVVIITFQYLELPYGNVLSTLFPSGKVSVEGQSSFLASGPSSAEADMAHNVTHSIGLDNKGTHAGNEMVHDNEFSKGNVTDLNNDVISETDVGLNKSSTFDEGSESQKETSTGELVEINKNSTVDYAESSKNKTIAEENGDLSWESEEEGNLTSLNSFNQTGAANETPSDFGTSEGNKDQNNVIISEGEIGLNRSSILDEGSTSSRESSTEQFVDLNKNSTVDYAESFNKTVAEEASKTEESFSLKNDTIDVNTSNNNIGNGNFTSSAESTGSSDTGLGSPLPALTPTNSSTNKTLENDVETNIQTPVVSVNSSTSSLEQHVTPSFDKNEKVEEIKNNFTTSSDNSSPTNTPKVGKKPEMPPALTTIADMNNLFYQSRVSYYSKTPRWSSGADQVLLNARSQIENAPIVKNDPRLYAPLFRNVSMFKRSYELMESTLKVYVYQEGKRPIVHTPILKGIYASEGWFMKQLEANKKFVTKNPREAHLFYLPFSSRMLEETLYVPDSHNHKNLIEYLKNYVGIIAAKYPFWNRTEGADHFLVACHDWAPSETRKHMANCIRALCNSDIREGYIFGKDVSLPETYVRNPQKPLRDLGGKPPSKRSILAFFAGSMHGYLRPILLEQWGNKDPDMKIFGKMPNVKGKMNYIQHMKSSKYCLCPRGYEVNSPRVVEAIFYGCVPVIISDNFVPPFFEVLNWESFAVFVLEKDIPNLKKILLSIPEKRFRQMQLRVKKIQQHFLWHPRPEKYDIFHMILHSVWYNRVFQMKPR